MMLLALWRCCCGVAVAVVRQEIHQDLLTIENTGLESAHAALCKSATQELLQTRRTSRNSNYQKQFLVMIKDCLGNTN